MFLQDRKRDSMGVLEDALGRLLGLAHLYRIQLMAIKNQKVQGALEWLAREKNRQIKLVQETISARGSEARSIRISAEHPASSARELIPWIYQEEQAMALWYQEKVSLVRDEEVKVMLQNLLKDQDQHLRVLKELYRGATHC